MIRTTPILLLIALAAACNPFAPSVEEGNPYSDLLGDPTTIDGYFTAFRTAYELRDIALYEPLLDSSFTFVYFDFDDQVERQWGFAQELEGTRRLFAQSDRIQLEWNQVLSRLEAPDGREAEVIRSFDLLVALGEGNLLRSSGNAHFYLARPDSAEAWRLIRWRDESEL